MVLQISYFRSGFRIGQRIVGQYFIDFWISYMFRTKYFLGMVFVWLFIHQVSSFKACVRYFSLFLKEQCSFWLYRIKYFEKKFNLQLFYLPLFHEHVFSHELPRAARLLKTSCFEKITVCVIETMLVTLPLVQRSKLRKEVNQQIKRKPR